MCCALTLGQESYTLYANTEGKKDVDQLLSKNEVKEDDLKK